MVNLIARPIIISLSLQLDLYMYSYTKIYDGHVLKIHTAGLVGV